MDYILLIIPFFTAFTAWLVIKIFLKLLFHPSKPRRVLGIKIQGVLPQLQAGFAEKLGKAAAKEFEAINLEEKIGDPRNLEKLRPLIEQHVDDFLRVKLKAEIPMIGMLVGDKMIASFKKVFMREIEVLFPEIMKKFAGNLQSEIPVENIVKERIRNLSPAQLEAEIMHKNRSSVNRLFLLAALVGFLAGCFELGIILLAR